MGLNKSVEKERMVCEKDRQQQYITVLVIYQIKVSGIDDAPGVVSGRRYAANTACIDKRRVADCAKDASGVLESVTSSAATLQPCVLLNKWASTAMCIQYTWSEEALSQTASKIQYSTIWPGQTLSASHWQARRHVMHLCGSVGFQQPQASQHDVSLSEDFQ